MFDTALAFSGEPDFSAYDKSANKMSSPANSSAFWRRVSAMQDDDFGIVIDPITLAFFQFCFNKGNTVKAEFQLGGLGWQFGALIPDDRKQLRRLADLFLARDSAFFAAAKWKLVFLGEKNKK